MFIPLSFATTDIGGFSHQNEWRNVSLGNVINGQKQWVFGGLLFYFIFGFLHFS
jgi:hypothetical protein